MTAFRASVCLLVLSSSLCLAQPALVEPAEFPPVQPGPQAVFQGPGCFLLAQGTIIPGDVDWVQVRIPRGSTRTVVDVDFPTGSSSSALLAMVVNGTTGFNIADNNSSTRDGLCGLSGTSTPVGDPGDSAVDLRNTHANAVVNIGVTGAADNSFIGLHSEFFSYEIWVYALTYPCTNDSGCTDFVSCTLDQCDVASGDCTNTPTDSVCDDGSNCTGSEWCDALLDCRQGPAPVCQDDVDCTDDYCDWSLDECVYEPVDEWCDNGLFCDGFETCDAQNGCQAGPVACDDGSDCTLDSCDEENWQCVHTPDGSGCDDGLFCNGVESCDPADGCLAGSDPCPGSMCRESDDSCVSCLADADCDDGMYCNGAETCDPQGHCAAGTFPCGQAMCREADDQCVECLSDSDCNDSAWCNGAEVCGSDGACTGGQYPCGESLCRESDDQCVDCLADADCDDGAFCNGVESCDTTGSCVDGEFPCGDSMCRETDDRCVQCLDDADCDDQVFCNGVELCDASGACGAGQYPCGQDRCRESDQQCVECLSDSDCADGSFCNGGEVCDASGTCVNGIYPCGVQQCDENIDQCVDCLGDTDCDDGLFCNGLEKCDASGVCAGGDSPCPSVESCNEQSDQCMSSAFSMDVRPGVCPAKINTNVRGKLPVAVVGVDVQQVDFQSIHLSRVDGVGTPVQVLLAPSGQAPYFDDVSAPTAPCECSGNGPDGYVDLVVSFSLDQVIESLRLDKLKNGTEVELRVSGKLVDGRPYSATDCVIVQVPRKNGAGATP